ncbi:hypothetical protein ACHAPE_006857 [Trichoderma viride]
MSPPEINIDSIIRYVCSAKSALSDASAYCARVASKIPDLPDAFAVAAQHLPTLKTVFTTIHESIIAISGCNEDQDYNNKEQHQDNKKEVHNNTEEKLNKIYSDINDTMKDYAIHVTYLQQLFETVGGRSDNADSRLKKYKKSVQDNKGTGLEKVMLHLLECAIGVAKEPLVTQGDIKNLEKALDDVTSLSPLFDETPSGATMNNFGAGNQFQHNGVGHQNICEDGFQVNGNNDNATYHFQAKAKDADKSEKSDI